MGTPKAWLPFGSEFLLQRMVRVAGEAAGPVVVAARDGQTLPALPTGVGMVHDAVVDAGPVAGIAAGLAALSGRCDAALIVACDHPLLGAAFARRLIELLGDGNGVVPVHQGRRFPLLAVYRVDQAALAESMLADPRGGRSAEQFAGRCGARLVEAGQFQDVDPRLESLGNVNDPGAYAAAQRSLSG
jgi:molybdopterin-guanine dinucleotide biosynthesis protein A